MLDLSKLDTDIINKFLQLRCLCSFQKLPYLGKEVWFAATCKRYRNERQYSSNNHLIQGTIYETLLKHLKYILKIAVDSSRLAHSAMRVRHFSRTERCEMCD